MKRRTFLRTALSAAALGALGESVPRVAFAAAPSASANAQLPQSARADRAEGRQRRPQHARPVHRCRLLRAAAEDRRLRATRSSSCRTAPGLHPSLAPLLPLWKERQLAVLQGVGYPDPNLSHFRSIEIWDTASKPDEYLTGRLAVAHVRGGARAARVRRGRRHHRLQRSGAARGRRHARRRARQHRAVPAPGAARVAGRRVAQQGARAHPEGRGGHRAGGCAPRRALRVQDRISGAPDSATRSRPRARSSPIPAASRWCA